MLVGVKILEERFDSNNRNISLFENPYTRTPTNSRMFQKFLRSNTLTRLDVILKLSNLTTEDIPICIVCGLKKVVFNNNLFNPKFKDQCSARCGRSLRVSRGMRTRWSNGFNMMDHIDDKTKKIKYEKAVNTRRLNGTLGWQHLSDEKKSIIARKVALSAISNGNGMYQRSSKDELFQIRSKANKTALKNGTHNTLTKKNPGTGWVSINLDGTEYKFRSKAELKVFLRFKRIILKYYSFEKYVSTYKNGKLYVADFIKIKGPSTLPDVIEVKSGNLFKYKGTDVASVNYNKFKSVIDKNLSILIIDGSTLYKIKSLKDLNSLFKPFIEN